MNIVHRVILASMVVFMVPTITTTVLIVVFNFKYDPANYILGVVVYAVVNSIIRNI